MWTGNTLHTHDIIFHPDSDQGTYGLFEIATPISPPPKAISARAIPSPKEIELAKAMRLTSTTATATTARRTAETAPAPSQQPAPPTPAICQPSPSKLSYAQITAKGVGRR